MQVSTTLRESVLLKNEHSGYLPGPYTLCPGGGQILGTRPTFPYPWIVPETLSMRTFMVDFPDGPIWCHRERIGRIGSDPLSHPHGSYQRPTEGVLPMHIPKVKLMQDRDLHEEPIQVVSPNSYSGQHTPDQDGQTLKISSTVLDLVLNGSVDVLVQSSSSGSAGSWLQSLDWKWPIAVRPHVTEGGTIRGAVAAAPIPHGTELGPLLPLRSPLATDVEFSTHNQFLWEVYNAEGGLSHYVQPAGWMSHVGVAPTDSIQNLEVVQRGTDIYYKALRNIGEGETLLVWYGPSQSSFFGIIQPTERSTPAQPNHADGNTLQRTTSGASSDATGGHLRCTVCKRGFNSRSNLRSHMRTHTLHRPFKCSFCDRGFSQSSTLRNHIRLHTGEKPYKCLVCQSSYSQLAGLRAHQKSARHRPKQPAISASPPST